MAYKVSILLFPLISSIYGFGFSDYGQLLPIRDSRPVVGVLTLPNGPLHSVNPDANSYIVASYVKHLESAGLRVAPLYYNATNQETEFILSRVNGVLFTGGSARFLEKRNDTLHLTQYVTKAKFIIERVLHYNEQGIYYPLWGTCLGMELIHFIISEDFCLQKYDGWNYTSNVLFTYKALQSKMLANADNKLFYYMTNYNITAENHRWGINPSLYRGNFLSDNPQVGDFFDILGLSIDKQGAVYVSISEAKNYPVYTVMFHPEKPAL